MMNTMSRRTPYDDAYGTCAETRAELRIYPGTSLLPSEITARLKIEPSETIMTGDRVTTKSGRTRTAKNTVWSLSSESHVESLDIRRHLDWLLALLSPQKEDLTALQDIAGVRMSVNCAWYSRAGHGGPTLWPEQMKQLADLNLECSFDIYFLSE